MPGEAAAPRTPWLPLLLAWLGTRALLVAVGVWELPFYPRGPLAFDDLAVYARWVPLLLVGELPTDDMWQYPPASAFFFVLGGVGSHAEVSLQAAILIVDLVLTVVLARHAARAGWAWIISGLLIGPVLVARFDVVPTLFAVLAVLAVARPAVTGVWAAIGAAMKVWPVLVLSIVPRRSALSAGGAFLATTLAVVALAALVFDQISGFLGGQGRRGLQVESVGALPFLVANAAGAEFPLEYRYGSMEVAADGAGAVAVIATVAMVVLFAAVAVAWWRGVLNEHPAADVAFTVVIFSVVVSRVFSPQYTVWLLGIGALCVADRSSRVQVPVLLVAVAAAITQVLYPWGYGWLLAGDPWLMALQVARIALVVTAAVLAGSRILRRPVAVESGPS